MMLVRDGRINISYPEQTLATEKGVYIGSSGWVYATWKPDFYPKEIPAKKFLDYYATRLNAVEVNYTFRQFPSEKTLNAWVAAVPAGFRFAIKANQRITHFQGLRNTSELVVAFLRALQPLYEAGRLGPILFQLPPNFKLDEPLLRDFLSSLPRAYAYAFEFRDSGWFSEGVFAALREFQAALCIADSEALAVPDVETAQFCYYRFRRSDGYSSEQLAQIIETLKSRMERQQVFAFFKHEELPQGALQASEVLRVLGECRSLDPNRNG